MSIALIGAALLAFGVAVAHTMLGERYIVRPLLRRPDLQRLFGSQVFTRQTIRFAWHLTSLAWVGLGAVLLVLADVRQPEAVALTSARDPIAASIRIIAVTFLASAVVTAVATRFRHLAWVVFLAIGVLAMIGT